MADINDCYLEAAIKIRAANAYFVPSTDALRNYLSGNRAGADICGIVRERLILDID